jgi:hypothetical protein
MYIETIIAAITTSGMLSGILIWLTKGWISERLKASIAHEYAQKHETYKSELKASHNIAIEHLRTDLTITANTHSIQYKLLQEKRGEVIAEIYLLLSEVESQARLLANPLIEPEEPPKAETYRKTANHIYKLFETYNKYRIYLTEDTCVKLDEFIQQSRLPLSFFKVVNQFNSQDPSGENTVLQSELKDKFMKVWDEVETKVPNARKAVEIEFRKTLGVVE